MRVRGRKEGLWKRLLLNGLDPSKHLRRPGKNAEYSMSGMRNGNPRRHNAEETRSEDKAAWAGVERRDSCSVICPAAERRVVVHPSVDPVGVGVGGKRKILVDHPRPPQLVVHHISV